MSLELLIKHKKQFNRLTMVVIFRKALGLLFMGLMLSWQCSSPAASNTGADEQAELKPIAELTYVEIWGILLEANNARGMDVHGQVFGEEALASLAFEMSGNCAAGDCGAGMFLTNSSEDSVDVVIAFAFDLPANPVNSMFRAYVVPPQSRTKVGCSKFCYGEEAYPVNFSIQSAGFK